MITLLLADDNEIVRKAVAQLLSNFPGVQLLAEAGSFRQMMELMFELQPDVVLMDVHMADEISPSEVKACLVDCQLIAISVWPDKETALLATAFGAATLLDKSNLASELLPLLELCAKNVKRDAGRAHSPEN
jgi:DNA-binding NarL/FixJ family response regulator